MNNSLIFPLLCEAVRFFSITQGFLKGAVAEIKEGPGAEPGEPREYTHTHTHTWTTP